MSTNLTELYPALMHKLSSLPSLVLPRGHIVFHGGTSRTRAADLEAGKLMGVCRWTSEDASYACDYGLADGSNDETGFLWVCRLRNDTPALLGSQTSLHGHAPWGNGFASLFPKAYESYAHRILGASGPVAFVNRVSMDHHGEILLTSPEQAVEVLDMVRLPCKRPDAQALGRTLNEKYSAGPLAEYAALL